MEDLRVVEYDVLPAGVWNMLGGDRTAFQSLGWLRAHASTTIYCVVWQRDLPIVLYAKQLVTSPRTLLDPRHHFFRNGSRAPWLGVEWEPAQTPHTAFVPSELAVPSIADEDLFPAVVCAGLGDRDNCLRFLASADPATTHEAVRLMLRDLAAFAESGHAKMIYFPLLPPAHTAAIAKADPSYLALFVLSRIIMPVPATFADYLSRLKSDTRADVRRNMRRYAACGLTTRYDPRAGDARSVLEPLFRMHRDKYGWIDLEECMAELSYTGLHAFSLVAEMGGDAVGAITALIAGKGIAGRHVGIDDSRAPRDAHVYFNLTCYELLQRGIDLGATSIDCGFGMDRLKVRYGCDLYPLMFSLSPRTEKLRTALRTFALPRAMEALDGVAALHERYGRPVVDEFRECQRLHQEQL